MISKSTMIATATDTGGNAAYVRNGVLTVATIADNAISTIGYYDCVRGALVVNECKAEIGVIVVDNDDAELLGSTLLAAAGRVLAARADNGVALIKGANGWVGVRA